MYNQPEEPITAVAAIRVSSTRQGTDGDSPEAQREQIERWATNHNIKIKETFIFLESASKAEQPIQRAIDYCKNPKNDIQLFIIKSIDRFTRGGSDIYGPLKTQLERYGVKLVDIYGVIGTTKVNTLDHLGFKYSWSEYSPTQKAEILEAERAKDEMRDIMSRMIGAEIRYTQMGYWMRRPPYGLASEKVETSNGKRSILVPDPATSHLLIKLFEMRASRLHTDKEIAHYLNEHGYKSRVTLLRDPNDRTKIVGQQGGKPMLPKDVSEFVRNPIYAGVICEKWTNNQPIKAKFQGIISVELFNKANRGKLTIEEDQGMVKIVKQKSLTRYLSRYGAKTPEFAYRKVVLCPDCERPLLGSASRGKLGKYYPAYHCSKQGHYFRISKEKMEDAIKEFIQNIQLTPEYIDAVTEAVIAEWDRRQAEEQCKLTDYDQRIASLQAQATAIANKIKILTTEVAIKCMEDELVKIDAEIASVEKQKQKAAEARPLDIRTMLTNIRYLMEHLEELLLHQSNPVAKAEYFGLIFNKLPTYAEIVSGTQNPCQLTGVNELFRLKGFENHSMVSI